MEKQANLWTIMLSGGDGDRLRPSVQRRSARPPCNLQFAKFANSRGNPALLIRELPHFQWISSGLRIAI
jgi:hypothetical protein